MKRRESKSDIQMRTRMAQALVNGGGQAISLLESGGSLREFERRNRLLWDCLQYRYHAGRKGELRQVTMVGIPLLICPDGEYGDVLPNRFPRIAQTMGASMYKAGVLAPSARRPRLFEQVVDAGDFMDATDLDALSGMLDRVDGGRESVIRESFPFVEDIQPVVNYTVTGPDPLPWMMVALVDHAAGESWQRTGRVADQWTDWQIVAERCVERELVKAGIKGTVWVGRPSPLVNAARDVIDNDNRLRLIQASIYVERTYGRDGIEVGIEPDTQSFAGYRIVFLEVKTDRELLSEWWACLPGDPEPTDKGAYDLCDVLAVDGLVLGQWIYTAGARLH